ncbi:MAG: hypothetical protein LQ348_000565 [Seirophora lacunosa]|nr:MAG: hypothetical protein LQ348_000565 [Seirophora lacunosa]
MEQRLGAEAIAEPGAPPVDDFLSDATQIIDAVRKSELQPYVGYMKELGLDFGWGPTAFLQWSLEHVVVHLETPWWASLAITTLAIRLFLFGLHIGASDNAARLEAVKPHLADIRKRLDEAKETRNMRDMLQYNAEMRQVYAVAGIKMWKNFLPFLQFPLAFGMFRLTRNMAWLPVPGLNVGGVLWFQDLTISDPYFLLPLITGTTTFYMFKPEAPAQGLLGRASSKFKNFIAENQASPSGGRTKAQIAEAKRYEEKRMREIKREKQVAYHERQRRRSYEKQR